mgnify:CR=1 FL=1
MSFKMDREEYAQHYGPTVGDSVRLGDTNLFATIEKDFTVYGQESKFGGGKVLRDGMGVSATEHVTIHQLLIPLLQVQPSLTIQVLLKQISVFVMVRLLLLVAVVTQIQWTMWTLLWVLVQKPLLQKV